MRALEQLLTELEAFLKILENEKLSSTALIKKCLLSELLKVYLKTSSSCDEEYIYMNKVVQKKQDEKQERQEHALYNASLDFLTNGDSGQHSSAPQKSLPTLPPPKTTQEKTELSQPKNEAPEGYYEEAEPYSTSVNEDGEAVSSSYESYDEEECAKGKSATHQHQWPSNEATIKLMKDASICAFLWRKKWLGQWAKQLCVIKDTRLLCYKSSKDQNPQLDVNLLGCTVTHKEKLVRKQEHKLKIIPVNADVIVLGMQSKDQAEQWLKVIQEISSQQPEGPPEGSLHFSESQHCTYSKTELTERYSVASESGSSTDGHAEIPEVKEVKKKGTSGLKLSNLMNLGRKKSSSMESPERSLETSSYLNVLMNSQWRSRWCCIKNSHLHFYQDKNRNKVAQQPVNLVGCEIIPSPSPDHLYSFRIVYNGEELAMLETKSSDEMGHWLGLLLSESGSKANPEEFVYDYVDADRISCIVNAAKNSFYLMQRKYSEPNPYIDNVPRVKSLQDDLYDDVDACEQAEDNLKSEPKTEDVQDQVYLDLTPVKSFLYCTSKTPVCFSPMPSLALEAKNVRDGDSKSDELALDKEQKQYIHTPQSLDQGHQQKSESEESPPRPLIKIQTQQQKISFPQSSPEITPATTIVVSSASPKANKEKAAIETKLGKNRTEAEVKRYTEERDRLERDKEEIRSQLAHLRKERRELKEALAVCADKIALVALEEKLRDVEEECKMKESRRVDLELSLVDVKENLRKAEAGPVTLGTAVDTTHLELASPSVKVFSIPHPHDASPVNSAITLKNRPLSIMTAGKGTVLQKAKEWEKKQEVS
ncbi:actin filament-associated protein 1-like 2 isoform X2 [Microcaecilia unicolor]|uniref:Actin filament-associated protein 1-like 2 n=1 Tax=Microcaecilia unicolor TaxID=1415580 RepID=A0A6P7Y727_9AMPH|nr:actin filament-associated protein 1-like 2 isoform X2 [Microcaecilia unicolor]